MQVTYNLSEDIGKVRLLITDTDINNQIFYDEEIQSFLDLTAYNGENNVRLAAAEALYTMARSEALVLKRITLMDLSTDGPATAKSLMDQATQLRELAQTEIEFDWAEMGLTNANRKEIIINKALREG